MAFFKRIEVWVLLLISAVLIWFVLGSEDPDDGRDRPDPVVKKELGKADALPVPPQSERLRLNEIEVARQGDHLVVSLLVAGQSREPRAEPLNEETARLVTGTGAAVPWFFLAFDAAPALPAKQETGETTRLRYWLPAAQSNEALWLEIDGERLPVKEAGAFPWQKLADNEAEIFSSSQWTH